jgi:hypothetical protein
VTNSLLVAQALAHANRVEVVMTGGTLRGSNYALVGSGAEQSLQGLRVSRAFLSGSGLTAERGLSTSNMLSASVDRALVQAASEVVVLADHTKLGTDTMFQTVPTDVMTRLVTDKPPPQDERAGTELQALADQGVQITVAGLPQPAAEGAPPAQGGGGERRGGERRREMPMPGQRRNTAQGGAGSGPAGPPQLRSAPSLPDQAQGGGRVADLAPRRR